MSEVLVKFYNTDYVVFYNSNKGEEIIKEDYQDYFVKSDGTQVMVLENKNQILCSF